MTQLFSFEWQTLAENNNGSDVWFSAGTSWPKLKDAVTATSKWAKNMNEEGCPIVARVVEIVDDGKNGKIHKVI